LVSIKEFERTTKDLAIKDNLMPYTLKPSYTKINLRCVLRYLVLPLGNKIMDHKVL
jgi:hypothetical protein